MSPILTRPVREQLEHDRVIRLLQARYKRKTDVIINPGNEENQSITVGDLVVFPDVLIFAEGTKKLLGTIEVETGESVNSLEARAEWAVFCKLKVPLHLYVPPTSVDAARRLCAEYAIPVAEVWTFHTTFDQVRFTMIYRSPDAPVVKVSAAPAKAVPATVVPAKVVAAKPVAAKPLQKAKPPLRQGSGGQAAKAKPVVKSKPKAKPAAKTPPKKAKAAKKAKPAKKAPLRHGSHLRQGSGGQAGGQAKPAKKRR
ncbi:MAG: hypothetical protein Q8O42_08735 [Acidobacteriota bacterium]|nr:hypothetical protein [Acidobacteriota bacterium]